MPRISKGPPTLERLKYLLGYDLEAGVFTWRHPHRNGSVKAGAVAGSAQDQRGHRQIIVDGVKYHASKLAWFYVHGEWPDRIIRFDDGDVKNLRFTNLRYGEFHYASREGRNAYDRAHRKRRPEVQRNQDLKKTFGITLEQYNEKLVAQGGVCAICHKPETLVRRGAVQSLSVDHDHETAEIRDLLCSSCNSMVGYSREDPEILRAAAAYLERHAASPANVVPLRKDTA